MCVCARARAHVCECECCKALVVSLCNLLTDFSVGITLPPPSAGITVATTLPFTRGKQSSGAV